MLQNCDNTWCPAKHFSGGVTYLEGVIMHEARQPIISHGQVHPLVGRCTLSSTPCMQCIMATFGSNFVVGLMSGS